MRLDGDPDVLAKTARSYTDAGEELTALRRTLDHQVWALASGPAGWAGPASARFTDRWTDMERSLGAASTAFEDVAFALRVLAGSMQADPNGFLSREGKWAAGEFDRIAAMAPNWTIRPGNVARASFVDLPPGMATGAAIGAGLGTALGALVGGAGGAVAAPGTGPGVVIVASEGAASGARIGREVGGIAGGLIGAGIAWAKKGESDPTAEEMGDLHRQGEDLLGRSHSKTARERWQDWYDDLSKREKELYRKAHGPRPQKHGN